MADIKLDCKCFSKDAKWNLQGVLNTVELIAQGNLSKLQEEIESAKRAGEELPRFKEMALEHLESDLRIVKELKAQVDSIPECS